MPFAALARFRRGEITKAMLVQELEAAGKERGTLTAQLEQARRPPAVAGAWGMRGYEL